MVSSVKLFRVHAQIQKVSLGGVQVFLNPYKPGVLSMEHRQIVKTQIRRRRTRRLIRLCTVCSQNVLLKLE